MQIPLNRVVAFAGPYFSLIAGAIVAWLAARVNIAGIPGLDQQNLQTAIAGGLAFLLTSGLTWAGQQKWLTGHHVEILAQAKVDAAAATQTAPAGTVSDADEFADMPDLPDSAETPDPA
jgi:hypothetical protein